jgi:hypothetical protein
MADDMVALVEIPVRPCPLVGYRDGAVIALCAVLR